MGYGLLATMGWARRLIVTRRSATISGPQAGPRIYIGPLETRPAGANWSAKQPATPGSMRIGTSSCGCEAENGALSSRRYLSTTERASQSSSITPPRAPTSTRTTQASVDYQRVCSPDGQRRRQNVHGAGEARPADEGLGPLPRPARGRSRHLPFLTSRNRGVPDGGPLPKRSATSSHRVSNDRRRVAEAIPRIAGKSRRLRSPPCAGARPAPPYLLQIRCSSGSGSHGLAPASTLGGTASQGAAHSDLPADHWSRS